jgi:hypothetical protein
MIAQRVLYVQYISCYNTFKFVLSVVVPNLRSLPENQRRSVLENQIIEIARRLETAPVTVGEWMIQVDRFNHDLDNRVRGVASQMHSWHFDAHTE